MATGESVFAPLERLRSTLFLTAGTILLGFAASLFIIGILEAAPQDAFEYRVFSGAGYGLAFLGLLGLYPELVKQQPWLSRAAGVFALLGAVMFGLSFVTVGLPGVAFLFGVAEPFALLNFAGLLFGFLLFGLATLRSDTHPRRLGVLLVLPSVFVAINFIGGIVTGSNWTFPWLVVALGSGQSLTMLAIGYTLRAEDILTDRARSPADATA